MFQADGQLDAWTTSHFRGKMRQNCFPWFFVWLFLFLHEMIVECFPLKNDLVYQGSQVAIHMLVGSQQLHCTDTVLGLQLGADGFIWRPSSCVKMGGAATLPA